MRIVDRTALIAGLLFIVLGVLFILEQAGVLNVRSDIVVPLVLVGLGVGLIFGRGDDRRHDYGAPYGPPTHPAADPPQDPPIQI